MPGLTPEQRARETIDAILTASGWVVQPKDAVNLSVSRGVAICELSFATGDDLEAALEQFATIAEDLRKI